MTRRTIAATLLVALTCGITTAQDVKAGGGGAPQTMTLEASLARALETSPEILLARAHLKVAEAELHQARMKVTREVLDHFARRNALEGRLATANKQYERAQALYGRGAASDQQLLEAQQLMAELKTELASLKVVEQLLLGESGAAGAVPGPAYREVIGYKGAVGTASRTRRGKLTLPGTSSSKEAHADVTKQLDLRMKEALDASRLSEALARVKEGMSGIAVVIERDVEDPQGTLQLPAGMTRRGALIAIADAFGVVFVLREYGIFVAPASRSAIYAPAETLPPGRKRGR